MDALENILNRVSARALSDPHPSKEEMDIVYKAALRAPDHAWLRTSSFIVVKNTGRDKLSKVFEDFAKEDKDVSADIIEKYKMLLIGLR